MQVFQNSKNPKSETLPVPSISDKGCSTRITFMFKGFLILSMEEISLVETSVTLQHESLGST
jgi:hypothetical protein